ncbi:MAG: hypothetical protein H0U79_08140 [Solirubrobacterales bacterium]|nr:hypothetical protein [Solirubrobacterales bacterium]
MARLTGSLRTNEGRAATLRLSRAARRAFEGEDRITLTVQALLLRTAASRRDREVRRTTTLVEAEGGPREPGPAAGR